MAKIIHYRNKCIGCGVCPELQADLWVMSKKDGKATLLNATSRKDIYALAVTEEVAVQAQPVVKACPVRVIKVVP